MKVLTYVSASIVVCCALVAALSYSGASPEGAVSPVEPMKMDMGEVQDKSPSSGDSPLAQPGQTAFAMIQRLVGKWEAPMGGGKTIVDTFQPFALGTAILGEEWVDGKQITATVFYLVGTELRADHYCDYLNQPRYVALPSGDPSVVNFAFRDATNLDAHPLHFHATRWKLIDDTHLTQDWDVAGAPKGDHTLRLNFVRQAATASLTEPLSHRIYLALITFERNANSFVKRALALSTDQPISGPLPRYSAASFPSGLSPKSPS